MEGFSETLLKEKTALVIGGTSGIGRSVVETFSSCGANVVVVGRSKSAYSKISFRPGSSNIFRCSSTSSSCLYSNRSSRADRVYSEDE